MEKIHDSYIDVNDQELFFCETNITVKWLSASSIEKNKIKEYYKQQHRPFALIHLQLLAHTVKNDHIIEMFLSKLDLYDKVRVMYYT